MSIQSAPVQADYPTAEDFLPLEGTDHLEFYVGNAKQVAHYYQTAFGFQPVAYSGPETGTPEVARYVLRQGKITFVFATPITPEHPIQDHLRQHGDGVKAYALTVKDARKSWEETTRRGAESYLEPHTISDSNGEAVLSGIRTYGDTVHIFVERSTYRGPFLPGYQSWQPAYMPPPVGLKHVDHCVGNVDWGEMNKWVEFYGEVLGFKQMVSFDDKDISTEYSALMSKVMSNGNEWVKFPINEPAKGKKKSQIEEYIDFNHGAGVQHIALASNDILTTVAQMRARGVQFLEVPETYYDDLLDRVGPINEDVDRLREHRILVDRDEDGYLLQLFTKPVEDRPTLFFEIIQRRGARSFGKGNFKALFEAIEHEQERRGNL